MNWDEQADVVCVGAGIAGMACAIAAVDAGLEVFVATSGSDRGAEPITVAPRAERLRRTFCTDVVDPATNEYFDALSSDLGPMGHRAPDTDVPIRVIDESMSVEPAGRTIAPFFGSRLRDWAARCLASPYGFLYSRVSDRMATHLLTNSGEAIDIAELGSLDLNGGPGAGHALADWLIAQGLDRGVEMRAASPLQRIVFEDGDVVGAVIATPDGPRAVRARHGVTVATAGHHLEGAVQGHVLGDHATVRVCLVRQTHSRFGRVELLTNEALDEPALSACRPVSRRLAANLHETHQRPSNAWRCGKVHRYPPLGQ